MNIVKFGWSSFKNQEYEAALQFFREAASIYGDDLFSANIKLCESRLLARQKMPVAAVTNLKGSEAKKGSFESGKSPSISGVLLTAWKTIYDKGFDEAVEFAKNYASDQERAAIDILYAHHYRADRQRWVGHVNRYLRTFSISPIVVDEKPPFLFNAIRCESFPKARKGPLVSIIMPAFNAEATLCFAVESILKQSWKNIELVIVDDCSSDRTYELMQSLALSDGRIKILRNELNLGPYISKNRALSVCEGEYITGHDADDWAHPERIANHMAYALENSHVKASALKMLRITAEGAFERLSIPNQNSADGVAQVAFISTLFERKFFDKELGSWDCVKFGADSEIINRARSILGKNFQIIDQLGMICLDSTTGLTSHPEFGTKGRTSDVRKKYKKSFLKWHELLGRYNFSGQYMLPFPHQPRLFPAPIESAVQGRDVLRNERLARESNSYKVDVVIITDLRFPGGNASTTLDELDTLLSNGFKVKVVHCPSALSIRKQISGRYMSHANHLHLNYYSLAKIEAKVAIVRNPTVIASPVYARLVEKMSAETMVYVVNNALKKANGDPAYDFNALLDGLRKGKSTNKLIFPLSNVIRAELLEAFDTLGANLKIASENWSPLFKADTYEEDARERFERRRVVIGRHSRDSVDKWPDSKEKIFSVYPEGPEFEVKILGGVESIMARINEIPRNWAVYPYGSLGVREFLSQLDFFVYFPSQGLKEAFGRVVMEAIFAGVPCILPRRFEETFGALAYYCDENEVLSLIRRLLADKDALRRQVVINRDAAMMQYESSVLLARLRKYTSLYEQHQSS